MKRIKNNKGMVLVELLLTVAITAVVSAVAFIGVKDISKNVKRVEADEIAKEIYIAAGNRMQEIKANGELKKIIEDTAAYNAGKINMFFGDNVTQIPTDFNYWKNMNGYDDTIYDSYVFNSKGGTVYVINSRESYGRDFLMNNLLPFGSVTEDVRTDSQYFIEFNVVTATVYGVFYIDTASSVSYMDLINALGDTGRENGETEISLVRETRENIKIGDTNMVVGYYGGGISRETAVKTLSVPEVNIENGEDLILRINDLNEEKTVISYSVKGMTSGSVKSFSLDPDEKNGTLYTVVLDSLTDTENRHFMNIFGEEFLPGEDLQITVVARPDDQYIAAPVLSTVVTNSLFERVDGNTAYISAIRHLENLDFRISGLDLCDEIKEKQINIMKVQLTSNLSFSGNGEEVKNRKNYLETDLINTYDGKEIAQLFSATYIPVENPNLTEFYGNGHIIYDLYISIDEAERLGLFGSVYDFKISDLGLLGSGKTEDWNYETPVISAMENTEKGTICGAFVAKAEKLQMERCFSTTRIYLSDDGGWHDAVNIIGGLAGSVSDACRITASYTGGMINEDGIYDEKTGNLEGFIPGGDLSMLCIGGLLGSFGEKGVNLSDELYLKSSYCTSSIKVNIRDGEGFEKTGRVYAGGLVGHICGKNIHAYIGTDNYMIAPLISDIIPIWSFDDKDNYPNIHMGGSIGGYVGQTDEISNSKSSASMYIASLYIDYFMDYCGVPGWLINGFYHYGFSMPGNTNIKCRNNYGTCLNFEGLFLLTKSITEEGSEDIYVLSPSQSHPISELLKNIAYPFFECTEMYHHYGDWQSDRHSVEVTVEPGYGIKNISSGDIGQDFADMTYVSTDLFYSIPVCLDDEDSSLTVDHKAGYSGKDFYLKPHRTGSNGILFKVDGHTYFAAGVSDAEIYCDATGLESPILNVAGGGAFAFNYADVPISFSNSRRYITDGSITIHYEVGQTPEKDLLTDYQVLQNKDINITDTWEAKGLYTVPKDDHYGSRYYWIKAYVTDERFTSEAVISAPVEVCFSRIRVNVSSGEGWFYD